MSPATNRVCLALLCGWAVATACAENSCFDESCPAQDAGTASNSDESSLLQSNIQRHVAIKKDYEVKKGRGWLKLDGQCTRRGPSSLVDHVDAVTDVSTGGGCDCRWSWDFECLELAEDVGASAAQISKGDGHRDHWCKLFFKKARSPGHCPRGCKAFAGSVKSGKYKGDGKVPDEYDVTYCAVRGLPKFKQLWRTLPTSLREKLRNKPNEVPNLRQAYMEDAAFIGCPAGTYPYGTTGCTCGQGCVWGSCMFIEEGANWHKHWSNRTQRIIEDVSAETLVSSSYTEPPPGCLVDEAKGAVWKKVVKPEISHWQAVFKGARPPLDEGYLWGVDSGRVFVQRDDKALGKRHGACQCGQTSLSKCTKLAIKVQAAEWRHHFARKHCSLYDVKKQECPGYCKVQGRKGWKGYLKKDSIWWEKSWLWYVAYLGYDGFAMAPKQLQKGTINNKEGNWLVGWGLCYCKKSASDCVKLAERENVGLIMTSRADTTYCFLRYATLGKPVCPSDCSSQPSPYPAHAFPEGATNTSGFSDVRANSMEFKASSVEVNDLKEEDLVIKRGNDCAGPPYYCPGDVVTVPIRKKA